MALLWWFSRPLPRKFFFSLHTVLPFGNILFFWFSPLITLYLVALVPYVVFSLFHTLTFVRTNLLPLAFPPRQPATPTTNGSPSPAPTQSPIARTIQTWVKSKPFF